MEPTGWDRTSSISDKQKFRRRGLFAFTRNGGPEPENLEPVDPIQFLEELENWADVRDNEPEALRLLASFSAEAADGRFDNDAADDPDSPHPVKEQPEPSP